MPDIVIETGKTLEDAHHRVARFVRWINTSNGDATITFTVSSPLASGAPSVTVRAGQATGKLAILAAASGSYPYTLSVALVSKKGKKKRFLDSNGEVIIDG